MPAMNYEILIRRAYNCGRYGRKGADADIFRALEREEWNAKENPKEKKKQIKYTKQLSLVKGFVLAALNKSIERITQRGDEQDNIDRLRECITATGQANNKDMLSKAIEKSMQVFLDKNIGFTD